jgi:O-antigen/teichoic acid export membrane protein
MALAGGIAGTLLWSAGALIVGGRLFPELPPGLVLLAGVTVLTQLSVATAKSCSQGTDDLPGANRVIVNEEFMFLPAYCGLWALGAGTFMSTIAGLLLADVATSLLAWARLARRGFFGGAARPSVELSRRIASYGIRAQLGGIVSLLNLRLDFILLNLLAGPAVLGVYAIASKFAELLKIPPLALTYVLYPKYARDDRATVTANARRLIPRAGALTAGSIIPLWLVATYLIPALYGSDFRAAIAPAHIILFGLALEGSAAVITAFLYGVGRPGLNSLGMVAGLAVTLLLDVALIPRFGAMGAATASAVAYATSTLALMWFFGRLNQPPRPSEWNAAKGSGPLHRVAEAVRLNVSSAAQNRAGGPEH